MGVLDYFPEGYTPRDVQAELLTQLQSEWLNSDVFSVTAPTASGKTAIALTLARWSGNAAIITPNNLLLEQYVDTAPKLPVLRKRAKYWCAQYGQSCEATHHQLGHCCNQPAGCTYTRAVAVAAKAPVYIANYYSYLAHRNYRQVLIIDEAHLAFDMLKDLAVKRLWRKRYHYPDTAREFGHLLEWIEELESKGRKLDTKLVKLRDTLRALKPSTLVHRTRKPWGRLQHLEDVLELLPLDVRREPPVLWPPHRVRKIVLLSATLGQPDVQAMGLGRYRVTDLECRSPIAPDRRPVVYDPVANLSYRNQDQAVPELAQYIEGMLETHREKGLIHAPYSIARQLRDLLKSHPRLLWHSQTDKSRVYSEFVNSPTDQGLVLVGSGMYEGLSLDYELAQWQVITKVPYMSLADPAVRWLANNEPESYAWAAVRAIMQASGRICRAPDDIGHTYIVDTSFARLRDKWWHLFANWWQESFQDSVT